MRPPTVTLSLLDRVAGAISPKWGAGRIQNKMKVEALTHAGYVVPGSRKKSMKGVVATPNSPDADIIDKLPGMRALSRDMAMNSDLAISILRRHKILTVGPGLQVQSSVDREFLGLDRKQAETTEAQIEREFDSWAESLMSDFDGLNVFGDNQALGFFNLLASGDFFWMPVWRPPQEKGFPYELTIKLIDADLVRSPVGLNNRERNIQGGIETDAKGTTVAVYVWDSYPGDMYRGRSSKWTRVPIFDKTGRRQIYHVIDPERIAQRRGVPILAPVADTLKQLTRLSEAQLMSYIISSYFTVIVKDASGLGSMFGPAMTPQETVTGGGRYSPDAPEVSPRNPEDGNDVEMGIGNVVYLDEQKDVTIADPHKGDRAFKDFWEALATPAAAGANMPIEQALMKYQTSYTAAKAAANDAWKYRLTARSILVRRFCLPVFVEWMSEAALRGRIHTPGIFDDYAYKRAWTRSTWVGMGVGSLDPLREAKASAIELNSFLTTHEDEYTAKHGGRWDAAMDRRAREKAKLEASGLEDRPDPSELVGPDGQQDEDEDEGDDGASTTTGDKGGE